MEKNARLKLTVRNLPYTVTEASFKESVKAKISATNGCKLTIASSGTSNPGDAAASVKILQFHQGQAPSKFKKAGATGGAAGVMGGGTLPSWASVLVKNVAARDELIALLDHRPFNAELFPTQMTSIEFSAWERVTFSTVSREKIVDPMAGAIFEDPDYLSYVETLKAAEEDSAATAGAGGTQGLEAWLAEANEKNKTSDPTKLATNLVSSLIGKWYHGKKLPWELLAAEEADEEGATRRGRKSKERISRKDRKRLAKEESRKSKKSSSRVPNREQQVVAEAKEEIRKDRRREEKKREKEKKATNHEAKLARIERQERKKEIIRAAGGEVPKGRSKKGKKEEKSGSKFTVTSTKTAKNFPSLPGHEDASMTVSSSDDRRPPPTAAGGGIGGGRSSVGGGPRHQDPTPSGSGGGGEAKSKMKIMKRGDK